MDSRYALAWMLSGVMLYGLFWFGHDRGGVPRPGSGGNLPVRRPWLHRILRRGEGPVLLVSVLGEAFAVAMLARGVVIAAGNPAPLEQLAQAGLLITSLLIGIGGFALAIRSRRKASAPSTK